MKRLYLCLATIAIELIGGSQGNSQDKLVLRDLSVIVDSNIKTIDFNRIELENGKTLFWDQIHSGVVASDKQILFDEYVKLPGDTLFAIRSRLASNSFELLEQPIQQLDKISEKLSNDNLILLQTAKFHLALARGEQITAVEPAIKIAEMQQLDAEIVTRVPANARVTFEPDFLVCQSLLPVFFEAEKETQVIQRISSWAEKHSDVPLCAGLYYSSIAHDQDVHENGWINKLRGKDAKVYSDWMYLFGLLKENKPVEQWKEFVDTNESNWPKSLQVTASYHYGTILLRSKKQNLSVEGQLRLLKIAAEFGEIYPELAAASVFEVFQKRKTDGVLEGTESLQNELMLHYPDTHFGSLIK